MALAQHGMTLVCETNGIKLEDPEINPHNYSHLFLTKGAKNTFWRKRQSLQTMLLENWLFTCRRLKLEPYLSPVQKSVQMG
jgi:hypothetical protein